MREAYTFLIALLTFIGVFINLFSAKILDYEGESYGTEFVDNVMSQHEVLRSIKCVKLLLQSHTNI